MIKKKRGVEELEVETDEGKKRKLRTKECPKSQFFLRRRDR